MLRLSSSSDLGRLGPFLSLMNAVCLSHLSFLCFLNIEFFCSVSYRWNSFYLIHKIALLQWPETEHSMWDHLRPVVSSHFSAFFVTGSQLVHSTENNYSSYKLNQNKNNKGRNFQFATQFLTQIKQIQIGLNSKVSWPVLSIQNLWPWTSKKHWAAVDEFLSQFEK